VLRGRDHERAQLTGLLEAARRGRSGTLVLLGEAGVGKTALLDEVAEAAGDLRVVRVAGVESEMELPFAALHQLCGQMLDSLERLPEPQRDALRVTFGLQAGAAPGPFLLGLAVLTLLAEVAAEQPLVCMIDDAQWLDRASAQALGFVARRLQAESVVMVFAVREAIPDLRSLPRLTVGPLRDADARRLLTSTVRWPLDDGVREAILAEAHGNPLALLELPLGRSPVELAGGFGLPEVLPLAGRIEESFLRRIDELPAASRLLLLLAAADPVGDSALFWRAARGLGLDRAAVDPAEMAGLLRIGVRVVFRHTLVRSAVYRSASPADRRRVHLALAEATYRTADPDRRAWHRARATQGADESVAAELEASAGRAQARGGLAAAAAFLERAAELTADPARQADRELAAARAKYQAGSARAASRLLAQAEAGPPDELRSAGIGLLRGQMTFASGSSADGPALLLETAGRLERLDAGLARDTYLDALAAALYVGRFAGTADPREVAAAARHRPDTGPPRSADLLLDGLAVLFTDGYAAGVPLVRRALAAFRGDSLAAEDAIRWQYVVCHAAHDVWDDENWFELATRYVQIARTAGALAALPIALSQLVGMHLHTGQFEAARTVVEEIEAISEATGNALPAYGAAAVASWQGRDAAASSLIGTVLPGADARREGAGVSLIQYSRAVLNNGLGRHAQALAAAESATADPAETGFANWALPELVEAAVQVGDRERAVRAVERLAGTTAPSGTEWGLGLEARSRALVAEGPEAEAL
jgi:tetratricopeptide (TPR) repeat protein